jgi:ABC-2 type transport system ATP-binding protein
MTDNSKIALEVKNVTKSFRIPLEGSNGLKQKLINQLRGRKGYRAFTPLKNITFTINEGEFFGIVGKNGSGKSTLLKTIAGIYSPNKGKVNVNGSLVPFIELGVGFNPELTGRENVYLNGALLGFDRKQITTMYDDIVDFAELGEFMEERLKNYSSGMQVRLAFSIAIKAQGDILLLDEVLAVGDAAFQQKCYRYFDDLKDKKKTVILVTHDMAAVSRFCDRALYIDDGEVSLIGSTRAVANKYLEDNYNRIPNTKGQVSEKPRATIEKLIINKKNFDIGDELKAEIYYNNPESIPLHFGFQIFGQDGNYVFGTNTKISGLETVNSEKGSVEISAKLDLVPGLYYLTIATMDKGANGVYDYRTNIEKIIIKKSSDVGGVAFLDYKWNAK